MTDAVGNSEPRNRLLLATFVNILILLLLWLSPLLYLETQQLTMALDWAKSRK